jgi:hypothetical protein
MSSILNKLRARLEASACCALADEFEAVLEELDVPSDLLLGWQNGGMHDDEVGQFFAPSLIEVLNAFLVQDCSRALVFVQNEAKEAVGLTLVSKEEYIELKQGK